MVLWNKVDENQTSNRDLEKKNWRVRLKGFDIDLVVKKKRSTKYKFSSTSIEKRVKVVWRKKEKKEGKFFFSQCKIISAFKKKSKNLIGDSATEIHF